MEKPLSRVVTTDTARSLVEAIRSEVGEIEFHLSAGCCDGSGPMCYPKGEVRLGDRDVLFGDACGAPVWVPEALLSIWEASEMIFDVQAGSGEGFSLDNGRDRHFVTRSRAWNDDERAALAPLKTYGDAATSV